MGWLSVDRPSDDEAKLTKREQAHQNWLDKLGTQGQDIPPIGKTTTAEQFNNEEDEKIDDLMEDHESPDDDNDMEASRGNQANVSAGNAPGANRATNTPPWAL